MGSNAQRQLLTSLCQNPNHWNYAVLWKLHTGINGASLSLTWEDGYFDYPKSRDFVEGVSGDLYNDGVSNPYSYQTRKATANGSSGACPIGLLVAEMSHLQYAFGEGVVGEAALTGSHFWVSFNDLFPSEIKLKLVPECPDEWLFQFASGIKTILLVPILPLGVLQLGSLEEISEDTELVTSIREKFKDLHNEGGTSMHAISKRGPEAQSSSTLFSSHIEPSVGQPVIANSWVKSEDSDQSMTVPSIEVDKDHLSSQNPSAFQDGFQICEKDLQEIHQIENRKRINLPPIGHWEGPSVDESAELAMMENKLFELSCLMEEFQTYTGGIDNMFGELEETPTWMLNSCFIEDSSGKSYEHKDINDTDPSNFSSYLTFPNDCELHKALQPAFGGHIRTWNQSRLSNDICGDTDLICKKGVGDKTEPSWMAGGVDTEYLLEAVVANGCSGLEDTGSSISNSLRSPAKLCRQFVASAAESQSEGSTFMGEDALHWRNGTSECKTGGQISDTSSATLRSMISTHFKTEQHERAPDQRQPRKGQKMSTVSNRRAKPGHNQKPRPRDRQMIQDRVKELRELVPNGAKCSIDGLLDQTIKHMIYLRSVADQAEKLRELMHQQVDPGKSHKTTETKSSTQSGTSWAFEFGNAQQVCPIVVEDLAYPGHMVIEMICNEQGLFLEIAQVIRGLELTILKGITESRSDATWAHFIVEASKGFHRLDIFWPLMQLLQRKKGPISSKI